MSGYSSDKEALRKRLARIEGQVRGIARMVDEDRYCIDVLDQVSAVNKALEKVALSLFRDHLDHCVVDAVRSDADGGRAKLDEAATAIERLVRS
jgi:DNA-binding FrmR family transcriptional regulator